MKLHITHRGPLGLVEREVTSSRREEVMLSPQGELTLSVDGRNASFLVKGDIQQAGWCGSSATTGVKIKAGRVAGVAGEVAITAGGDTLVVEIIVGGELL